MLRQGVFLFISLVFASCSFNYEFSRKPLSPTPVTSWLYRGGQQKAPGFEKLRGMGIRTVVNFRHEKDWIDWERRAVESMGMKYVTLPWKITGSVKPELVDEFFKVLDDPANRPVFIHCKHGRDRTGVMTTLALMRYEKLSEEHAREQALETIHPNWRYRTFVNSKLNYFIRERGSSLR